MKRKRYLRTKTYGELNCHFCNNKFEKSHPLRKFCSKVCLKNYYSKEVRGGYYSQRFDILEKYGFKCYYCGKNPREDNIKIEIDHIIPKSKGGGDKIDNLVPCCNICNVGKSNRILKFTIKH